MLSNEELALLEEDLKHFLISNGIYAAEWKTLNENEPEKALNLVELFSDIVLQKIYEKLKVLEYRSKEHCFVFRLHEDRIDLIGLKGDGTVDLSQVESLHEALAAKTNQIKFFRQSKAYNGSREEEIHQMIHEGCVPSHEAFWMQLEKVTN